MSTTTTTTQAKIQKGDWIRLLTHDKRDAHPGILRVRDVTPLQGKATHAGKGGQSLDCLDACDNWWVVNIRTSERDGDCFRALRDHDSSAYDARMLAVYPETSDLKTPIGFVRVLGGRGRALRGA